MAGRGAFGFTHYGCYLSESAPNRTPCLLRHACTRGPSHAEVRITNRRHEYLGENFVEPASPVHQLVRCRNAEHAASNADRHSHEYQFFRRPMIDGTK